MRRPINTVNGTYKDPNLAFSAQDALNVIPMMTEKGGTRTVSQYRQAPGLKPFCRIGTNNGGEVGFVAAGAGRGLRVVDNKLYAVAGRNLWQITAAGVSINQGTIPGVARVSMAHNQRGLGNELAIDNGQSRYVFNTQTQDLQKVTDESFPGSIKAVFIDGYIVFVEPQGRYWGHSDLSNALNYNIFDQYEAEGQPDRIVSAHESNRELLIFGQDTTEAYVNNPSGSGEAPFVRATNTVIKSGCAARDSVCDVGPYTVYLDQNRTVQVLNGYTPVPISTSVIDSALQSCTKQQIANAYAFAIEAEGFLIYYLTVPGKFTFGYDFKYKEWHRRSSTGLDWWAVTDVVQWNGSWYALDSRRGDILELRWCDYPFDVQEELVREWATGTISADQNPVFVHELELLFGCGGQAYEPIDFVEQPEGPTVSLTLPDGSIGLSWAGGTATATGGTPPYRFTTRPGTSYPGNLGPMSSAGVIASEVPDAVGAGTVVVRVTDANGLWDETTAEFAIGLSMLAIRNRTVAGQTYGDYLRGGAGGDFGTATWTQYTNAVEQDPTYLFGVGSRFVAYATTGSFRYTEDYGQTWGTATGDDSGGSGGARRACVFGSTIIVPGGTNEMRRSLDGGLSYSIITGSPDANVIVGGEDHLVSVYGADIDSDHSTNAGDTWADTASPGLLGISMQDGFVFNGEQYFPGATTGPVPALRKTLNGGTFSTVTLPTFASATTLNFATLSEIGGQPAFVIGTDSGEFVYFDPADSTIKLSAQKMDVQCRGMTSNGAFVAAIGSSGGRGQIWTSVNGGVTWVKQRDETGQTGEWNAIASMRDE